MPAISKGCENLFNVALVIVRGKKWFHLRSSCETLHSECFAKTLLGEEIEMIFYNISLSKYIVKAEQKI